MRGERRTDSGAAVAHRTVTSTPRSWTSASRQQIQGLLDAAAHHVGATPWDSMVYASSSSDGVGDEPGHRVLADDPDSRPGHVAGTPGCPARTRCTRPARGAAGEVRHQPVDRAQQRGLAGPCPSDLTASLPSGTVNLTSRNAGSELRRTSPSLGRTPDHAGTPPHAGARGGARGGGDRGHSPIRMPITGNSGTGGTASGPGRPGPRPARRGIRSSPRGDRSGPTTSHSGKAHGSGRYRVRVTRWPGHQTQAGTNQQSADQAVPR